MHSPVPPQSLHSASMALTTPGYRSECHHRSATVRQRGGDLTAILAEISVLGAPHLAVYTKPAFKGRSSLAFGPDRFPAPVRTAHPAPLVITQKLRKNRLGQQKHRHERLCHTANTGLAGRWHSAAAPQRKSKGKRQKSKGKNLCAGRRAGLGRNLQGLAAIKTIVNDSILERRRKLATSQNLRGARRNGASVAHAFSETSLRK